MNKFCIFMVLLVPCLAYNHNDRAHYRSRYATNGLSGQPTPFERKFGRKPYGRTAFGRPFRHRFKTRSYKENYYRDKSGYTPLAAALRQKKVPEVHTEMPQHPNSSLSVFGFVKNGQNKATVSATANWNWVARVMPTYRLPALMICTAACVQKRIFITAAICIYNAKVVYTRVVYQDDDLTPIAFVVPSEETKEMFDDIGMIVVDTEFTGVWKSINISPKWTKMGRPDKQFLWHASPEPWHKGRAVGYVHQVVIGKLDENYKDEPVPTLYDMEVHVSNFLCNYLYNKNTPNNAYFVPCYSTCNLVEHYQSLPKCYNYMSGLGHIVVSTSDNSLIGVATWAGYYKSGIQNPPLPIGLSIANSDVFKEDLKCAEKIRDAPSMPEGYEKLCK